MKNKIGVGIITYNRSDYYEKVLESVPRDRIDKLVVVNDGKMPYVRTRDADYVVKNNDQLGVSKTKNKAINYLIDQECDHIFILEDDVLVLDSNIFDYYIKTAADSGIHHLCFGPVEIMKGNGQNFKFNHSYSSGSSVDFYHNPQGGLMYFNSNIIKKFGVFDEAYVNAFEHIDFAYKLIIKGLLPPFWYFADAGNSSIYLKSLDGSAVNSTITDKENYNKNLNLSAQHFIRKWGVFTSNIPDVGRMEVLKKLDFIEKNYKINK
jgi:GT2 family glycosyltransferase